MTEKQLARLKEIEERVRLRLMLPWTEKLHDLILYRAINNGENIRMSTIDREIEREIRKQIPDSEK